MLSRGSIRSITLQVLLFISNMGLAIASSPEATGGGDNTTEQIGNSYFKSFLTKPISQ